MQLFRKKLKDRDAKLMAKDAELQQKLWELEAKDKIIIERDLAVKSLTEQLAQFSAHSVTIQQAELEKQDVKIEMEVNISVISYCCVELAMSIIGSKNCDYNHFSQTCRFVLSLRSLFKK